jgi:hypothetical protein
MSATPIAPPRNSICGPADAFENIPRYALPQPMR